MVPLRYLLTLYRAGRLKTPAQIGRANYGNRGRRARIPGTNPCPKSRANDPLRSFYRPVSFSYPCPLSRATDLRWAMLSVGFLQTPALGAGPTTFKKKRQPHAFVQTPAQRAGPTTSGPTYAHGPIFFYLFRRPPTSTLSRGTPLPRSVLTPAN